MKEIGIIYSTEMVRAKLDDRKSMTRRTRGLEEINENPDDWEFLKIISHADKGLFAGFYNSKLNEEQWVKCPYGQPGDILWTRETWSKNPFYKKIDGMPEFLYAATDQPLEGNKWKPSIHMPKEAARIWDEVVSVRAERLQDIIEEEAKAEGASDNLKASDMQLLTGLGNWKIPSPFLQYQFGFTALWCRINGCESWLANPWVWVIGTKNISKTGKPIQ